MASHEKFNYKTLNEVVEKVNSLGVNIKFSEDLSPLRAEVKVGKRIAPNAIAILPMEGCDSNPDGSPSELVERRYKRFAEGGAGLLWWEACAVVAEGRANPLQMMLTKENMPQFKAVVERCNQSAVARNGKKPLNILQLTHSCF